MAATNNKEFKRGWIDSYYPYGQYIISGDKIVLGGDEMKVNNTILTQQVINDSTSGYSQSSQQAGGGGRVAPTLQFRIKSNSIQNALKQFENKVKKYFKENNFKKSELLVLDLESLDPKNKLIITKIYRKKI